MASIHPTTLRGEPVFCAQHSYADSQGKRAYIRGYGSTKAAAQRNLSKNITRRIEKGTLDRQARKPHTPTVNEFLPRWISYLESKSTPTQQSTISKYLSTFRNHITPTYGDTRLNALEKDSLWQHFHKTLTCGTSAKQHAYQALNALLNHAVQEELLEKNPLARVPKPKHDSLVETEDAKYAGKRIRIAQGLVKWLAQDSNPYRQHLPLVLMLFLGLRRSELLGLSWANVRQLNRKGNASILVTQQLAFRTAEEAESGFYLKPRTKSGKPRSIPLPEPWRKALIEQQRRNLVAGNPKFADLVFLHPTGALITWDDLGELWREILTAYTSQQRAPQPGDIWRLHANRHISASVLLELGVSIEAIQAILGHSDTAQALHYSHASRKLKAAAMDKLSDAFAF